jgi:endonuclease-3
MNPAVRPTPLPELPESQEWSESSAWEIAERADWIIKKLKQLYPTVRCELDYNKQKPFELLVATRLSAQCTDKRVNRQTRILFERYPDVNALANAETEDIAEIIRPCGLFNAKAKDIICMCKKLILQFDGEVPDNLPDLLSLPGVGRKTANLVLGELYGEPAYVTDTHVIRLSCRLGLSDSAKPALVEANLRAIIPEDESLRFCHRMVRHGRAVCHARSPECDQCELKSGCLYRAKQRGEDASV